MLVKSVEFKVPTVLAYDVARSSVGCPFRCRPRHLTRFLNYEAFFEPKSDIFGDKRKISNVKVSIIISQGYRMTHKIVAEITNFT